MHKSFDHTDPGKIVLLDNAKPKLEKGKRTFSSVMRDANSAFIPKSRGTAKVMKVGFVLPQNFSMMSFTAAVDVLVTANLVHTAPLFHFSTFGVDSDCVISDLGIEITSDGELAALGMKELAAFDVLIVCGGFRCSSEENSKLTSILKAAVKRKMIVGGIWNGALALAYAGLLNDMRCALHPDNHALMRERFSQVRVTENTLALEPGIITSAGPASALEMMLQLIAQLKGKDVMRAVREILSCDRLEEQESFRLSGISDNPSLPDGLRHIIQIMEGNIEEPLSIDELVTCTGTSRRQLERLFQSYLQTSPYRYYLELRITHARRLLLQSNENVTNVAIACGFVSTSHFSNCFKDFFGISPVQAREKYRRRFA